MIPFRKRKHRQMDPDSSTRPLKQKPTNVRGPRDTKAGSCVPGARAVRTRADVVFSNENVAIRLVEDMSEESAQAAAPLRRLNENTDVSVLSLQLDEFDQPPNSTSTPLGSPGRRESPGAYRAPDVDAYLRSQGLLSPVCGGDWTPACADSPLQTPEHVDDSWYSPVDSPGPSHTFQSSGAFATYQDSDIGTARAGQGMDTHQHRTRPYDK
ncbi:AaceriAFR407Cp [[Ashbya] aceris (nom. inval.)]|nr:AaceriAFR407Cp [[Ashbya] aceris (nom. inval.)]